MNMDSISNMLNIRKQSHFFFYFSFIPQIENVPIKNEFINTYNNNVPSLVERLI